MNHRLGSTLVIVILAAAAAQAQTPQGTGFTYQGRLNNVSGPANGLHDLRFRLYDALTDGAPVGSAVCVNNVNVVAGVFTVGLDFGTQFAGQQRFVEIEVRADTGLDCTNSAGLVLLAPRQPLTATPYASFATRPWVTTGSDVSYTGGFVGIGTAAPLGPLDVRSGGGSFLRLDTANGDMRFNGGTDGFFGFFNDGALAGATVFVGNNVTNMSIANNGGAVGIGTAPVTGTRLKVAGTVEADEFRFATDKVINISIDATAFQPTDQANIGDSGEGRYSAGTTAIGCSISLPDGMVITEVRWFIRDISGNNINLIMARSPKPYTSGTPTPFIAQSFSTGTPGVTTLVNSNVNHTVNNVGGTYTAHALPLVSGHSWDGGNIAIQGMTIIGTIRTPR